MKPNHKAHHQYNYELLSRETKYWQTELKNLLPELEGMPAKLVRRIISNMDATISETQDNLKGPKVVL